MSGEGLNFVKVVTGPNGVGFDFVNHRGQKRVGFVTRATWCLSCGHTRLDLGGPHAPRFENGELVDCVGRPVKHGR